ncbi:hypothetical protein SPHV1_2010001 [Novosphingobium sp. KN65.2]|nr:hypothetical protein SPHV1_2010001 [Novosphingobium sp. KN65.2]
MALDARVGKWELLDADSDEIDRISDAPYMAISSKEATDGLQSGDCRQLHYRFGGQGGQKTDADAAQ